MGLFLEGWRGAEEQGRGVHRLGGSTHLLKDDVDVAGDELCDLLAFSRLY